MRAVIQRVLLPAEVKVNNELIGQIDKGLVLYLGIENEDTEEDIIWLARKISNLRIFSDDEGKMNLSLGQINGGLLIISQFTLYASTKKGNRPSFIKSAKPDYAEEMYLKFVSHMSNNYTHPIATGQFGADMKVNYINDGPVTIIMDTKNKEQMTIEETQKQIDDWIQTYGVRYFNELTNMAILTEEVGELARLMAREYGDQSYKKTDDSVNIKQQIADELADIIFVVNCLANQMDIDLTSAMTKNIEKKTKRDSERHKNNKKL